MPAPPPSLFPGVLMMVVIGESALANNKRSFSVYSFYSKKGPS